MVNLLLFVCVPIVFFRAVVHFSGMLLHTCCSRTQRSQCDIKINKYISTRIKFLFLLIFLEPRFVGTIQYHEVLLLNLQK